MLDLPNHKLESRPEGGLNMLQPSASRKRIVVVNDDASYLELMKEFLTDCDFDVWVLEEPDVTLTRIKTHKPDLVVIDLIFGKEPNGWLILQHLQTDSATKFLPVLVCSAALDQMRKRSEEFSGARVGFLEKPFDLDVLLDRIEKLLAIAD